MRRMICATLALISLSAQADMGFYSPVGKGKSGDMDQMIKPAGPVQWLDQKLVVEGIPMVAGSSVREVWMVMFDAYGTPYLVHQKNGSEPKKLKIGSNGAGNQGNFEINGFPYLISRNQLVTIDDSILATFLRKVKPLMWNKGFRVAGESTLGAAVTGATLFGLTSQGFASSAVGAALVAALVWGVEFRDQLFQKSLFDLRRDVNIFTKTVLHNVVAYEEIKEGGQVTDVRLTISKGKDAMSEQVLMSDLIAEGKLTPDFRSASCITHLTKPGILSKQ